MRRTSATRRRRPAVLDCRRVTAVRGCPWDRTIRRYRRDGPESTLSAPRPECRDTGDDTMVGMGLGSVLLLAAIVLIWTASLWKLGGWAGPRGGGSMVAALIVGSIFGSFVGLLLVSVSASRETRRNRAVAIARLSAMG